MRKIILPMNISLDGYVEGPGGAMDWFPTDDESWQYTKEGLARVDTVLLGRVTYQIFTQYWPAAGANPSSSPDEVAFSRWIEQIPKVVFSRTLERVDWKNTRLVKEDIPGEMARLKAQPGKDITLVGGAGIAQSFIRLGLIDEYWLKIIPVVLGGGKMLFKDIQGQLRLQLVNVRNFKAGVVALEYRPA